MLPRWYYRDLTLGDEGDDVLIVQRKVDAPMTGKYDGETSARVRGVQRKKKLKETGEVDKPTAEALGEKPGSGQTPAWFEGECAPGCSGPCVAQVRILLHQPALPVHFDNTLEDAVRRFQSENGLKISGIVDKKTAILLADRAI